MAYTMNNLGLGGFLRVGPQRYPPRRRGAQVIMRGPHGMRLAADPVVTREGKVRGSGFRFWSEMQFIPKNETWSPKQMVVGVLGLSGLGQAGWRERLRYGDEISIAISQAPAATRVNGQIAASALASAISQAARQNKEQFQKDYGRALVEIVKLRSGGAGVVAEILEREIQDNVDPLAFQHFSRTPETQVRYMKGVKAAEESWVRYRDPVSVQRQLVEEERRRAAAAGSCVSWIRTPEACMDQLGSTFKKYAWYGVLTVGGFVLLSGLMRGFGEGIARRN